MHPAINDNSPVDRPTPGTPSKAILELIYFEFAVAFGGVIEATSVPEALIERVMSDLRRSYWRQRKALRGDPERPAARPPHRAIVEFLKQIDVLATVGRNR